MGKWADSMRAEMEHTTSQGQGSTFVDWNRGGPLTGAGQVQESPDPAGMGTAARVGMIENPNARMAAYARARFPDDPGATQRYGIIDNDIVYRGDDGQIYRETGTLGNIAEYVGGQVAMPMAGAAAGAAVAGPPGAALGGAAGLAYQKLGGLAQGDRQSAGGNARDLGLEGLLSWAGAKLGDVLGKKIANRRVVRDIGQFSSGDTQRLMASGKRFGVTLTPAEASNLGSLINQQKRLGQGMDEAGDILKQFYGDRAQQVALAVDDFIGKTPAASRAGASVRDVAASTLDDAKAAQKAASGPLYKMIDDANPEIPERAFMRFEEDDLIRGYVDKAVSDPKYRLMDTPRNSYKVIDRAGKIMGDEINTLKTAGKTYEAGALEQARKELLGEMDEIVPGYKDARAAWAGAKEYMDELEGGFEGMMARVKDPQLAKIPKELLTSEKYGPGDVSRWRKLFLSQGKAKEWDGLVNVWLRDVWEGKAAKGRTVKDMAGARFAEFVFGTPRQQKMLQEALSPKRYGDLKSLVEVLEATGRAGGQQSMTEPAMQAARKEAIDAAPVKSALRNLSPADPLGEVRDLLISRDVEKWRAMMARVISSKEAMGELEKLRVLKSLSPKDEKVLQIVSGVLSRAGVLSGAQVVGPNTPDQIPQMPALARSRQSQRQRSQAD
jgi:hypothetical protein